MTGPEKKAVRELGLRLKNARESAGLTQEALAGRLGVTLRRYQLLESGRSNMTFCTIVRIAMKLEHDVWDLLGGPASRSSARPS